MKKIAILGSQDVFTSTLKRIEFIFDNYDNIQLSLSGGKDSTVLFHLINAEAIKRNRKFYVFFLDQEAEYQGTIDFIQWAMEQPNVIPLWYQIPVFMTNACSSSQLFLFAWGKNEKWVREKNPIAIQELNFKHPKRFYKLINLINKQLRNMEGRNISIVGLRAEESLQRYCAMLSDGELDNHWIKKRRLQVDKCYPIIDWSYTDVWKYLIENKLKYNAVYDKLYMKGHSLRSMRVSNLIHEKSIKCLESLQEIEPETYQKLESRLHGVHCTAMYVGEKMVYSIKTLPSKFKTWKEYKNFLLQTIHPDLKRIFEYQWNRFEDTDDEGANRYMVKRLLLCDWEGNLSWSRDSEFNYTKEQLQEKKVLKKTDEVIKKWFESL